MKQLKESFVFFSVILLFAGFSTSCDENQSTGQIGEPTVNRAPLSEAELEKMSKDQILSYLKGRASSSPTSPANKIVNMKDSLSFRVRNKSGKPVYCCCFYYMKNKIMGRWRWDKSKIYKLQPKQIRLIVLDEIKNKTDREHVFGYLGVFNNKQEAKKAVMEIVDETKILDLDLLHKIKNKIIDITIKKYGITGQRLAMETRTDQKGASLPAQKELDLMVENQTGKDLFLTCFVYEQPENTFNLDLWRFSKTEVKAVKNGETIKLDIPTVFDKYKWIYMRGILGVFDATEQKLAQQATLELSNPINKVELGQLTSILGKKIILNVENYGILGSFVDYTIKPTNFFNKFRDKKPEKSVKA